MITLLEFTQALDVEKKKAEQKNSAFFGLNQDIVGRPQKAKCRLKYVISISVLLD